MLVSRIGSWWLTFKYLYVSNAYLKKPASQKNMEDNFFDHLVFSTDCSSIIKIFFRNRYLKNINKIE